MIKLNFPVTSLSLKKKNSNTYVFDSLRKKYVILTPEEWVRQHLVNYLIKDLDYPKGLIITESFLKYNNLNKRSDVLVLDRELSPFMVVECKSFKIKLNRNHIDQSSTYNKIYKSKFMMITNGLNHIVYEFNWKENSFIVKKSIPKYED